MACNQLFENKGWKNSKSPPKTSEGTLSCSDGKNKEQQPPSTSRERSTTILAGTSGSARSSAKTYEKFMEDIPKVSGAETSMVERISLYQAYLEDLDVSSKWKAGVAQTSRGGSTSEYTRTSSQVTKTITGQEGGGGECGTRVHGDSDGKDDGDGGSQDDDVEMERTSSTASAGKEFTGKESCEQSGEQPAPVISDTASFVSLSSESELELEEDTDLTIVSCQLPKKRRKCCKCGKLKSIFKPFRSDPTNNCNTNKTTRQSCTDNISHRHVHQNSLRHGQVIDLTID